jgi:trigger factor
MRPGEEREVVLTMPADFAFEPVRERELTFQVKLNGLKRQVLPEVDDALAARILPDQTLAGLRDVIRERVHQDLERRLADFKVNRVIEHLNRQVNFELPEQLLTAEIQGQADAMVERGLQAGMSSEEISGQQTEIFNAAGQQAQVNLRTHFILQEIAHAEHLEVSDRELLNHLAGVAKRRHEPIKKLIAELRRTNRLPRIRNSLLVGKAIDFLVAQAIVREVEPDAAATPDATPDADPEPTPPATDE